MGLSILIPVYNTRVKDLVQTLLHQVKVLQIPFEILLIDDCSYPEISNSNAALNALENVWYKGLSKNIGRSKVRNQLFEQAQYDICLIMDGDVEIDNDLFVANYWSALQDNLVVVGGHKYSTSPPENKDKYLHWYYGTQIEVQPTEKRKKSPYNSFKTVCFGIHKIIFLQIKFNEQIAGYGHEDTLFGLALEKKKIKIQHINNPLVHLGLDDLDVFLAKQKEAIINLKKLYKTTENKEALKQKSRLIKIAEIPLVGLFALVFTKAIAKNLKSSTPKLWTLQLQKIIWWTYTRAYL